MSCPIVVRGLVNNKGYLCYQNVIIQSLASVRAFHVYLHAQPPCVHRQQLFNALSRTLKGVTLSNPGPECHPQDRTIQSEVFNVPAIRKRFPERIQQDAHEFMQHVMNVLGAEAHGRLPGLSMFAGPSASPLSAASSSGSEGLSRLPVVRPPRVYTRFSTCQPSLSLVRKSASSYSVGSDALSAPGSPLAGCSSPASTPLSEESGGLFLDSPASLRRFEVDKDELVRSVTTLAAAATPSYVTCSSTRTGRNPFFGLLCSRLECQCEGKVTTGSLCCCCGCCFSHSLTYQEFLDLSLSIPHPASTKDGYVSIEDCLEMFTDEEAIDGVDCSTCSKKRTARKRLSIARAPAGLCLHLRRMVTSARGVPVKIDRHVEFDTELDLAPFCSQDTGAANSSSSRRNSSSSNGSSTSRKHVVGAGGPTVDDMSSRLKMYLPNAGAGPSADVRGVPQQPQQQRSAGPSAPSLGAPLSYDLVAVVVHEGSGYGGGHYYVYRKLLWEQMPDADRYKAELDALLRLNTPGGNDLDLQQQQHHQASPSSSFSSSASSTPPSSPPAASAPAAPAAAAAAAAQPSRRRWVRISDSAVTEVTEEDVLDANAYLLFYELREKAR